MPGKTRIISSIVTFEPDKANTYKLAHRQHKLSHRRHNYKYHFFFDVYAWAIKNEFFYGLTGLLIYKSLMLLKGVAAVVSKTVMAEMNHRAG